MDKNRITKYNPADIILVDFHIDKEILMVLAVVCQKGIYKYKFMSLSDGGYITYDYVDDVDKVWKTELLV